MFTLPSIVGAVALSAVVTISQAAWEQGRGNGGNTGFARVNTATARKPLVSVPIGNVIAANPVVAPDGTVYIGNIDRELMAFRPDGTPYWKRKLGSLHGGIFAAPAIGADGSVYVVSSVRYRDHREGADGSVVMQSYLHKFSADGAWLYAAPFPEQFGSNPTTDAAPNIWRSDGNEVVMVPAIYDPGFGRRDLRLIAFSAATGTVLADQTVREGPSPTTNGGSGDPDLDWCLTNLWLIFPVCLVGHYLGASFEAPEGSWTEIPAYYRRPLPAVAIRPDPRGGEPSVMVTDVVEHALAYSFSTQTGFTEVFRRRLLRRGQRVKTPVVLWNGDTAFSTTDGFVSLVGPNNVLSSGGSVEPWITAAPARLSDGRLAFVADGGLRVLESNVLVAESPFDGESVAAPAASCTHVFVSTTRELVTYSAKTLQPVAHVPLTAGLSAPVIGPMGHVYTIASGEMLVFPPPLHSGTMGTTACDVVSTAR